MKTEIKAKKLLCPKKLDNEDEKDRLCEASDCMMWDWSLFDARGTELSKRTGDCGLKNHNPTNSL